MLKIWYKNIQRERNHQCRWGEGEEGEEGEKPVKTAGAR